MSKENSEEINQNIQSNLENYLEEQKEIYQTPLQQTGLELASSIAEIISKAMLIQEYELEYVPKIFNEETFKKKQKLIFSKSQEQKEILLHNLVLELTNEYKNQLICNINCLIFEHSLHRREMNEQLLNQYQNSILKKFEKFLTPETFLINEKKTREKLNSLKNAEAKDLSDLLSPLMETKIKIHKIYRIYHGFSRYLNSVANIEIETLVTIMNLKEKENSQTNLKH